MKKTNVLFVCMGNICRSPTAEGVFRHVVETAGLKDRVEIDSAGTISSHVGDSPDRRAQQTASRRGYDLSRIRGRKVCLEDFNEFDFILAMDGDNLANLQRICPQEHSHKLKLFLAFSQKFHCKEVPDPYYGGSQGFENVLDMIEDGAKGLLEEIVNHRV